MRHINFNKYFRPFNMVSIILIIISLGFLVFKGLNYGVDFKGGTLIEVRSNNPDTDISRIRTTFKNMNLGDVSVKNFGKENDFIIKIEKKLNNDPNFINNIKQNVTKNALDLDFRRVESVGPKVSSELLKAGVVAICLSLAAMLIYIWIRFEWQFSLGAILALFHDVILTLGIFSLFSLEINLSIVAAQVCLKNLGSDGSITCVIYFLLNRDFLTSNHNMMWFELTF